MKYQLVIFDMDGTILDTLEDLCDSVNFALKQHNLPGRTLEEVRAFVGNGIGRLIDLSVPEGTPAETKTSVLEGFKVHYAAHCAEKTKPYDGICELIASLKKNGMKTAVVSNKADFAVQQLCVQYFDGLFDAAMGEREGLRRKPAPDMVEAVLSQLGVEKAQTVYIGDSEVDVNTAKNAGLPCIAVTWGFRDEETLRQVGAEEIVKTVQELQAIF